MPYQIRLDGRLVPLDARIDVVGRSVILHSRGGSTGGRPPRNAGYAEALIAICERAQASPSGLERVLVDSAIARRLPESDRVLISRNEIETTTGERLAAALRVRMKHFGQLESTRGGNSTKQVRFDFNLPPSAIINSLHLEREGNANSSGVERLSGDRLRQVMPLHIRQAVDRLVAGEDAPNFAPSRDYDLLLPTGERLAPKKVFGLAIEQALGIEAFPGHFSAGWEMPCFDIIQRAGFDIVDKLGPDAPSAPTATDELPMPPDPEEQSWAEGNPRLARHLRDERRRNPQACAAKRAKVREENQGRLVCENPACTANWYAMFPLPVAEAVFEIHHTVLVSTMQKDHRTGLDDLRCLCAACHRAEHRRLALEERETVLGEA